MRIKSILALFFVVVTVFANNENTGTTQSKGWEEVVWMPEGVMSPGYGLDVECLQDKVILTATDDRYITRVSGTLRVGIDIDVNANPDEPVLAPRKNRSEEKRKDLWTGKTKQVELPFAMDFIKELTIVMADEEALRADSIVTLSHQKIEIEAGKQIQLVANYTFEGKPRKDVTWTIKDKDIAVVDSQGMVTALKEGVTTAKAISMDGRDLFATCEITVIKATFTLTMCMPAGWNWISSNLSDLSQVADFLRPIADKVEHFVGFETELVRDDQLGLVGQLHTIASGNSYLIQTTTDIDYSWTGYAYDPEVTPIVLQNGWNWMGYVPTDALSLEDALKDLSPSEGDVVKSYDDFSTFSNGKWVGTLTNMEPGKGYMYFANEASTFYYPSATLKKSKKVKNAFLSRQHSQQENYPWKTVKHKYPNNMNMIAQIQEKKNVQSIIIGAFVDNECRGIGKCIGDKIFLTIYGDQHSGERVNFRIYDKESEIEVELLGECEFNANLVGSLETPFKLSLNGETDIAERPQNSPLYINIDSKSEKLYIWGELDGIQRVYIMNALGVVMKEAKKSEYSDLNVSDLPMGNYFVILQTDNGVHVKKVLKGK